MKFIILPILFLSLYLNAQFNDLGNYQNLTSLTIINPALSGMEASISTISNFKFISFSHLTHVNLRSSGNGVSLYHYNDKYNLSTRTFDNNSTSLQYAYGLTLTRKLRLRLGTGITQNTFYNHSNVSNSSEKKRTYSLKPGLLVDHNNFYFGVSGLNIPLNKNKFSSPQKNIVSLQAGTKLNYKKNEFSPSIIFLKPRLGNISIYNLKIKRNWAVLNLGYKTNGPIIGGGFESDRLLVNYTYSSSFSKLTLFDNREHSVMLAYKWERK